ncbi:MAG: hypothetical protein IIY00_03800 [Clostridia bacterium]|nr:hypothetical protein [Clostridia bacterium]
MKKMYRKMSLLLVLTMLFGMFSMVAFADEGAQAPAPVIKLSWTDAAPEGVTEVKLDLMDGETKVNGETALVITKDGDKWELPLGELAVSAEKGR